MTEKKALGPWFRTYASILNNRKLDKLSDGVYRIWNKLLAVACRFGGIIPGDIDDLKFELRVPEGRIRDALQVLLSANLLEQIDGGFIPHNWEDRQFQSDVSTSRVKRFRKRQADELKPPETVSCNAPETKQSKAEQIVTSDDNARAEILLSRICEILRIELTADPSRITWKRQVEEMLRDGLPEPAIIAAAEEARTRGIVKLAYIRTVAMNPKPKEPENGPQNKAGNRGGKPSRFDTTLDGTAAFLDGDRVPVRPPDEHGVPTPIAITYRSETEDHQARSSDADGDAGRGLSAQHDGGRGDVEAPGFLLRHEAIDRARVSLGLRALSEGSDEQVWTDTRPTPSPRAVTA